MTKRIEKSEHLMTEAQLEALTSPRTREVFRAFRGRGSASVSEIQGDLNCPSKTLYYQVSKLLKVGLLAEAGHSKGARRERAVYSAPSGEMRVPEGFQGARYEKLAAKGVVAGLKAIGRNFEAAADLSQDHPDLVDDLFSYTSSMSLSEDQVRRLKEALRELVRGFAEEQAADGRRVSVMCVMTPHASRLKSR